MKPALIILIVLGSIPWHSHAQDQLELDSLLWAYQNADSDTTRIRLALDVSDYYFSHDYVKAAQYAKLANELAHEKGLLTLEQRAERWQGNIFFNMGDYKSASIHFFKAMRLYESSNDSVGVFTILVNLGAVHDRLQEYDKALNYYLKSQTYLSLISIDDKRRSIYQTTLYNNIANIYQTKSNFQSAREYYEKSLQLALKNDNKVHQGMTFNNLGKLYLLDLNQPSTAFDYLQKGLKVRRDVGNKHEIARSLAQLSTYYLKQQNYEEARLASDEALKLGLETGSLEDQRDGYNGIQLVESARNNYKEALSAAQNFKKVSDSIQDQLAGSELAKLQLQYDFEKTEQANVLEQNRIRARYTIAIIALAAGLLIAVLIVIIVRYRARQTQLRQKNLAQDVEMKNKELTTNVIYLIRKNELINDVAERLLQVKKSIVPENQKIIHDIIIDLQREADNDSWKEFELRFNSVHSDFYDKIRKMYPGLSPADEKLCAFLRLNMSSKEIAALTKQSVKSVEVARARLRKKLNLTNTTSNLVTHLSNL
jgi:tetratricopeptide (TPR) repeat protein/DNA-binding CsgD family transcriptional regulator